MSEFVDSQDFLSSIGTIFNEGEPTLSEDGLHQGQEGSSAAARHLFPDPMVVHRPMHTPYAIQDDLLYSPSSQNHHPNIISPTSNLPSAPASSSHLDPSAPAFSPSTPMNTHPYGHYFQRAQTQYASSLRDSVLEGEATASNSPFNHSGGYVWQDQTQLFPGYMSPISNGSYNSSAYGGYQQEQRGHTLRTNAISPSALGSPFNPRTIPSHQNQQGLGRPTSSRALRPQQHEPYYAGHHFEAEPFSPGAISVAQAARLSITSAPAAAPQRQLSPSSTSTRSSRYPCSNCKRSFPYPSALAHHERNHKPDGRIHQCIACNVSFLFLKDLKRHNGTKKHRNKVDECPDFTESTGSEPGPRRFCPMTGCKANRANADSADAGFSRKDHLLRHFKKQHPRYHLDNVDEEMSYSPASM